MKIRHSCIVLKEGQTMRQFCDYVNQKMSFTNEHDILTPEKMVPNIEKAQFYKMKLNSYFGKVGTIQSISKNRVK